VGTLLFCRGLATEEPWWCAAHSNQILSFFIRRYIGGMNDVERDILGVLTELDGAIQRMRTAQPKPNLLPLFDRIDALTSALPRGTDPSLLHYLHKKSYEKARLWLEGRDAENARGQCLRD
jgi:hypothetical protein